VGSSRRHVAPLPREEEVRTGDQVTVGLDAPGRATAVWQDDGAVAASGHLTCAILASDWPAGSRWAERSSRP